jgi:hypothetical protein
MFNSDNTAEVGVGTTNGQPELLASRCVGDLTKLVLEILEHRDDEHTGLLYLTPRGVPTYSSVQAPRDAVATAANLPGDRECYFSANPVRGPVRTNSGRGKAVDVTRLAALLADLDVKPGACASIDDAKVIIADLSALLGTEPMALVYSGGGVHAYWKVEDGDNVDEARVILARWKRLVAGVAGRRNATADSVHDLSRMLRIPGSFNNKQATPRPVTAEYPGGAPLTMEQIAEQFDAYGIPARPEDFTNSGEVIMAPDEWRWGRTTCSYVAKMIAGFRTDAPIIGDPTKNPGRNPWWLSQTVRLACAHRMGCITEADYLRAENDLAARFAEIVADPKFGDVRTVKALEQFDIKKCARDKAAAKTDQQVSDELGGHNHGEPPPDDDYYGPAEFDTSEWDDGVPAEWIATDWNTDEQGNTGKDRKDHNAGKDDEPTTWEPIDLTEWLSGDKVSPNPEVGITRTDGLPLLYAGKEHIVFGETECGKSWFALQSCAVEIRNGNDVVYVHFEEGDPASTIERLRLLAVPSRLIAKHLRFAAPARPVRGDWLGPLLDPPPSLVILDGVNEAICLHGDDANHIDGASEFRRHIVKPFLAVGAASLSCDHVTKSGAENRGRYSMGTIHKTNAIDGAAFLMENVEPFGRGMRGASSLFVTKDRPGQLRQHGEPAKIAGKTFMGMLAVDATGNSPDFLTVFPPNPDRNGDGDYEAPGTSLADEIYNAVWNEPGHTVESQRAMFALLRTSGQQFRNTEARDTLDDMVATGQLLKVTGRRGVCGFACPPEKPSSTASRDCVPSDDANRTEMGESSASHDRVPTASLEEGTQSDAVADRGRVECVPTVGRSGTQWDAVGDAVKEKRTPDTLPVCTYCGKNLAAHMSSQIARGYCGGRACVAASKGDPGAPVGTNGTGVENLADDFRPTPPLPETVRGSRGPVADKAGPDEPVMPTAPPKGRKAPRKKTPPA